MKYYNYKKMVRLIIILVVFSGSFFISARIIGWIFRYDNVVIPPVKVRVTGFYIEKHPGDRHAMPYEVKLIQVQDKDLVYTIDNNWCKTARQNDTLEIYSHKKVYINNISTNNNVEVITDTIINLTKKHEQNNRNKIGN